MKKERYQCAKMWAHAWIFRLIEKKEKLIPDETFVLVGYCKNNLNIDFSISKKEGYYNFRMDDDMGSLFRKQCRKC
jgi:hypothetical protein